MSELCTYLKQRRLPVGLEWVDNFLHLRVFAPECRKVIVGIKQVDKDDYFCTLNDELNGYFSAVLAPSQITYEKPLLYWLQLNDKSIRYPDPASRYQPTGPHGLSQVINPNGYQWSDNVWLGIESKKAIIYEMHIGTFTKEGTWRSASKQLDYLAKLGITVIEMMPIAEFAGCFGWGYDGVNLFAPYHFYGKPDDLRAFIDKAHQLNIGVILDVVYNHLGPDGNYLSSFTPRYFSKRYTTDWGEAINFDDEALGVREFFKANAYYWIDEYHFDGLRIDASQNIFDTSTPTILQEIVATIRERAAPKTLYIVAENEPQDSRYVRSISVGGSGMDALCNDDFHHAALVRLIGKREAYYTDYKGSIQEFISSVKYGFLYQGQWYQWQTQNRGAYALDLDASCFINFLQNHDQIANTAYGKRIHQVAQPGVLRALTALLLLSPQTPMIFQGQEFAANQPFNYFADHKPIIAKQVCTGRLAFLKQFLSIAALDDVAPHVLPNPTDKTTFLQCKIDPSTYQANQEVYQLYQDLIAIRKKDKVFNRTIPTTIDGAILSQDAFVLRFTANKDERLLLINLGVDIELTPIPEPLLAPPRYGSWTPLWSSEEPYYGGNGTVLPHLANSLRSTPISWHLTGYCVIILANNSNE